MARSIQYPSVLRPSETESLVSSFAVISSVFAHSPLAMAITEGEGHLVRYANGPFCRLVAADDEALIDHAIADVLSPGLFEDIEPLLNRAYHSGEAQNAAVPGQTSVGHDFGVTYAIWPILIDAKPVALVIQVHTATDLLSANQQLLLAGLNAQEQALKAQDELTAQREIEHQKENFFDEVAHDLRTPLTTVKGFTQLLLRRLDRNGELEPDRARTDLRQIESTVQRMVVQIDELVSRHQIQLDRTLEGLLPVLDLGELIALAVAQHQETRENCQITFSTEAGQIEGRWDVVELERVLGNLLSNAIKYSPGGCDIVVRLDRENGSSGPHAILSVQDHGIGIPMDDLPHVFERHFRSANVAGIEGSGIGLAGVREIVVRNGGTVAVESTPEHGTTFSVRLPLTGLYDVK